MITRRGLNSRRDRAKAGNGHCHVDRGADHRIDDGVEIALPDALVGEHLSIASEGHTLGQQQHFTAGHGVRI